MMPTTRTTKIILIGALLLCLFNMPYGFYQLVRFIAFVGFAYLAYQARECGRRSEMLACGVIALLIQPFFKISLGHILWAIVDLVIIVFLLLLLMKSINRSS